jgi:phosphate transport system permease protein
MTDAAAPPPAPAPVPAPQPGSVPKVARSISEIVQARVRGRYAAETRFRYFGLTMVALAVMFCAVLLGSILIQSATALTENRLTVQVQLDPARIDPAGNRNPDEIRQRGDFQGAVRAALEARFPAAATDGSASDVAELVTPLAVTPLARKVAADPSLIGQTVAASFPVNDDLDLILKGGLGGLGLRTGTVPLAVVPQADGSVVLSGTGAFATDLGWLAERNTPASGGVVTLGPGTPSILIEMGGGTWRFSQLSADRATASLLVTPASASAAGAPVAAGSWTLVRLEVPEETRPLNDTLVALGRLLVADGSIKASPNLTVLTNSDSNEPELAGLAAAIVGSILTLIITFLTAVPLGVAAAIYLEEFAPKNRWTDLIEVNINNLAAVPSIVFGLLGFAVFLTFFGMPRSAPIVGGVVLTLMSLPVIIIASRAALKAVPPSIREAALGVGASKMQAIFHHVLPLAMPGILTGSILAMAHALGETAPLLMIGMVAFIADIPQGFNDASTVLPVEIFMWASRPERAWDARTALAIIVLLVFMVAMNGLAIWLRRRFERRW